MSQAELKDRLATIATSIVTVPLNRASSGDGTAIQVVQPGQFFSVYGFWLQAADVVTIIWKSGGTSITGSIPLSPGQVIMVFDQVPILKGRASGDDLFLNLSGNVSVQGWVNLTIASR